MRDRKTCNLAIFLFIYISIILFGQNAIGQSPAFGPGDKVEAKVLGWWISGEITNVEDGKYVITFDQIKKEFKFKGDKLRLLQKYVPSTATGTDASLAASTPSIPLTPSTGEIVKRCGDGVSIGVLSPGVVMIMVKDIDPKTNAYYVSIEDLICKIKTAKVNFTLTPAMEKQVSDIRHSPELIEALKNSYFDGENLEEAQSVKGCGWSKGRVLNEIYFWKLVEEKDASSYFLTPINDLICIVKTRGVSFKLTAQKETRLKETRRNNLVNSLISELENNYRTP